MNAKKHLSVRIVAIILIVTCIFPVNAMAVEPRASDYLFSYSAYVYPAGWGKIQVWFDVTGVNDLDEIGALEIQIYESKDNSTWTWVDTYMHTEYPDMLGYDNYTHTSYIQYNGTIGRYYKAYVCIWGGRDGDGDTRYFWTSPEKATLFAG